MAKEKTLNDLFLETMKDVYYAEKQASRMMPKMAKAVRNPELRQALETHREESEGQVDRLEQVFEMLGKPARGKSCEAMQGLLEETKEVLEDFGQSPALDAGLIACAQAVEHYEIARYGTLKTWATQLGMQDAAKLLDETLQEEKRTDEILSRIAEGGANADAGQGELSDDDEEDESEEAPAKEKTKGKAKAK